MYSPLLGQKKDFLFYPLPTDLLDKQPLSGFKGFIFCTRSEILISSESPLESPAQG